MKTAILGLVSGLLLIASAGAHGLVGWPQVEAALTGADVDGKSMSR